MFPCKDLHILVTKIPLPKACLKIAIWQLCVTFCGRLDPNEGGVVGYVDPMRA